MALHVDLTPSTFKYFAQPHGEHSWCALGWALGLRHWEQQCCPVAESLCFCLQHQQAKVSGRHCHALLWLVLEYLRINSGEWNFRVMTPREHSLHQKWSNLKYFVSTTICTSLKQPHWKKVLLPTSLSIDDVHQPCMTASCEGRATSFCITAVCNHYYSRHIQATRSWEQSTTQLGIFLPYLFAVTVLHVSDSTSGLTFQLSPEIKDKYQQWK